MTENRPVFKIVSYENMGDHIEYKIGVKVSNTQSLHIQARYRVLRDIYAELKEHVNPRKIPEFPPKRMFNNMHVDFVCQRQRALETFFNNLLQKYSLDELQPLKAFVYDKRRSVNEPIETDPAIRQPVENSPVLRSPPLRQQTFNVIEQYKKMFFDLNDNFNPPDVEDPEARRKRNKYETSIKIDFDLNGNIYKLPVGNESNLISIQDETIPTQHKSLSGLLTGTLDQIKAEIKAISFPDADKIIKHFE